jgi:hypothetical protein
MKSKPLIIKGTSIANSYINQIKRTIDPTKDDMMGHNIPKLIENKKYLDYFKEKVTQ